MRIEEVARAALGALDCDASFVLASQWASERYQQLSSRIRFRHLRETGTLTVPATYSTGTVSVTRDSTNVVGTATAWTPTLERRWFRARVNWYRIVHVADATHLTLEQPFSEATSATASYKVVQRMVPVDSEARWLGNAMMHPRLRRPLDGPLSMAEFDRRWPERQLVGPPPTTWGQTEYAISDGVKGIAVEIYPYPTLAETLMYVFWRQPPALLREDEVPNVIDGYQLKEGVLVDVMRYNASKYAQPGAAFNLEAAAYWRNEYRSQMTSWERVILDVGKNDKGVDDLTFLLQLSRARGYGPGDIRNAHDEVYSRGNRP